MHHEIVELHNKYLLPTYNRFPLTIIKGQGSKVWDAEGKIYLDFLSGIAVNPLGHCHPAIVKAITSQAEQLIHISNLYYTKPAAELAELLCQNGGLDKIFFCNSGTEANEAAIKLARKYQWRQGHTEKYKILTATHAFHGRTLGSLAATPKEEIREGFGPFPEGFHHIAWNDAEEALAAIDRNTAAVLIEPIQGEGGIHCASPAFLHALRSACNKTGALLIFDEIQCGLGRIGTLFAYESFGVKPDIITLAKGIASGLPFAALCATDTASTGFQSGDHGTTFGANPVAAAAALATLTILIGENYPAQVAAKGAYLRGKLEELQQKYPHVIVDIRGKGLMLGIELQGDGKTIVQKCHDLGLLVNLTGKNVLRLLPPYIITLEEIDQAIQIIERSCNFARTYEK